jgi:copper chaperone NosL
MRKMRPTWVAAAIVLVEACAPGTPAPASLDTAHDACRHCRMIVSNERFASQIVAPHAEPMFFDDLGCLGRHLADGPALPDGAAIYVADHRTAAWVRAELAVYTRAVPAGPMGSPFMAHESAASRDADPDAEGDPVSIRDVLPAGRPPGSGRRP